MNSLNLFISLINFILLIVAINPVFLSTAASAADPGKVFKLAFPENGSALSAVDQQITGVVRDHEQIFLALSGKKFFISLPFHGIKKRQELSFGGYIDSVRNSVPENLGTGDWRGIAIRDGILLMVDGTGLRTFSFATKDKAQLSQRSIVWDLIKPAADRGGEPTKTEVEQLRARFKKAVSKTSGTKISGIAPFSVKTPKEADDDLFLAASRLPGFPVILMRCGVADLSNCRLDRSCFVEDKKLPPAGSISGIAYSSAHKLLLLGDNKGRKLKKYRYHSCFHIAAAGEIALPAKIKNVSNVHVDHEGRLWVSSDVADDYHNASVFTWGPGEW